jgi:3',5'-cyclic-AMP phosphodiesterase
VERGRDISGISRPLLSRRQLLRGGLALAACAGTWRPSLLWADERSPAPQLPSDPDCTRWALLSDTHIAPDPQDHRGSFHPYRNLQEVTAQVAAAGPDGVVIAGDLARLKGKTQAYENVKALLLPIAQRPIYLGLGNHDDRDDFFQVFGHSGPGDRVVVNKHITAGETGPVRMIVLDTLLYVNVLAGKLGELQRTWLETALQACDDKPTILFLHHPPSGELLDTRRLVEIIKPQAKIKAIICGHLHKYEYAQVAGIHLIYLPATAYPVLGYQPVGWVEAKLTRNYGEFTLHALAGNRKDDGRTQKLFWRA